MDAPIALTRLPHNTLFKAGDVFVLFGELFGRGYANGLVNEARKAGMQIVGITVGRRDENNALRALTADELTAAEANLGGRIVNVPLMAGFDMDAPEGGPTPTDLIGKLTLNDLRQAFFDDWGTPYSVCRPPRPNTRGVMTATTAMILMRPGEGHLEACPMPALNKQFTTYSLTPDRSAQKQAAE